MKRIRRSKRSTKGLKKPVFDPSDVVNSSSTSQQDDDSDASLSDDCIDTNEIKINRSSSSPEDKIPLSKYKAKQKTITSSSSKGLKGSPQITFLPVEQRKCARPGCNNFSMSGKIYCSNECILRFAQMTKGNTDEMHGVPQPKKGMVIKPKYSKAVGNSGRLLLSPNSLPAKPRYQGRKILIKRKGTDQVVQSMVLSFQDVKVASDHQFPPKPPAAFQQNRNSPKLKTVVAEDAAASKQVKKIKPYKPARQAVEERSSPDTTSCTKEFREPDAFDFIRHNDNKYKRVKIHRDKSDVSKFDRGISAAKKAHQSRLKGTVQTKPTKITARSTFGDQLNTTEHETLAKLKEEERLRKKRARENAQKQANKMNMSNPTDPIPYHKRKSTEVQVIPAPFNKRDKSEVADSFPRQKRRKQIENRTDLLPVHKPSKRVAKMPSLAAMADRADKSKLNIQTKKQEDKRMLIKKKLEEVLQERSKNADPKEGLQMQSKSIKKLSYKIEEALFQKFPAVDHKYQKKFRTILFNLKDEKNVSLLRKVMLGSVSCQSLVSMTSEQMASQDLLEWRKKNLNEELDMIQQREEEEVNIRPVAKITHKGTIAINEDLSDMASNFTPVKKDSPTDKEENKADENDTTMNHGEHEFDQNCKICTGLQKEKVEIKKSTVRKSSSSIILSKEAKAAKSYITEAPAREVDISKIRLDPILMPEENELTQEDDAINQPKSPENSPTYNEFGEDASEMIADIAGSSAKDGPLWEGSISMHEMQTFNIHLHPVCGECRMLGEHLPLKIELGGRIRMEQVWKYVGEIKRRRPDKTISVVRLDPASSKDKAAHRDMIQYFLQRRRFGVLSGHQGSVIKDMYIIPLSSTKPIYKELCEVTNDQVVIALGDDRLNSMLIGLIIRNEFELPPEEFLEGDEILGEENTQSTLGMAEVDELYEDVSAVYDANATADHDLDIGQTPPDSEPEDADYLDQSNSTYNRSTSFNQTNDVFEHSVVATDESMVDLLAQSFEEDHESSTHDESLNSSSHTQASMETTSKVMSMINSVRNIPVQISENSSLLDSFKEEDIHEEPSYTIPTVQPQPRVSSLLEEENDPSEDYQSRMEQITKLQKEIELRQQRLKTFDKNPVEASVSPPRLPDSTTSHEQKQYHSPRHVKQEKFV